jgi:hypothetical protein
MTAGPRSVRVHLGIAWVYRHTQNTSSTRTHAVVNPDGARYRGETWDKPWRRLCDDGPADERRPGWVEDVTCKLCRAKINARLEEGHDAG